MKVAWTTPAATQLHEIFEFIAVERPAAAERMVRTIRRSAQQLVQMPFAGRIGKVAGSRELVVAGTPYLVAYRVEDDSIQILAVLHGAQEWPDSF